MLGLQTVAINDFQGGRGRIRVGDTSYSAICDKALTKGQAVVIVAIKDGRLQVSPAQAQASDKCLGRSRESVLAALKRKAASCASLVRYFG